MKYRNTLMVIAVALLFSSTTMAGESPDNEAATKAEEAALQAKLKAEYEKALFAAEQQRLAAETAVEKAREQLHLATEQKKLSAMQSDEARALYEAEMSKMHEELNHTHRQLQQTTREIARVNREVARARAGGHSASYVFRTSERPVIGVILGDSSDKGVEILGVSPDGPSDRAGIKQGDIIVAASGRVLSEIDEEGDAGNGLRIAMRDIKPDEPLVITVERDEKALDLTVVPEIREPLSWQSVVRFPTAPVSPKPPGAPRAVIAPESSITIERMVVPEINSAEMAQKIEQMRSEIEKRRAVIEVSRVEPVDGEWEIELHELSELGNSALQDANVWFGLPMAQGLQLAEVDPGLGEYFKTDRGVLVLKARTDNDLQLESGDVILQVGDTKVNSPAEFMRALRGINSGDELVMDIKRHRKDRTLKTVMQQGRTSFYFPGVGETHTFTITSSD
jgi:C-terminal processing protease CtpA/Prc